MYTTIALIEVGIPAVENRAREYKSQFRTIDFRKRISVAQMQTEEQVVRALLQKEFLGLMEGSMPQVNLEALKEVLFTFVYPINFVKTQP